VFSPIGNGGEDDVSPVKAGWARKGSSIFFASVKFFIFTGGLGLFFLNVRIKIKIVAYMEPPSWPPRLQPELPGQFNSGCSSCWTIVFLSDLGSKLTFAP